MKNSLHLLNALLLTLVTLLASPLAAAEWTDLPLAAGAREVYVSSSVGNDANDGLTTATAKRTLTGTPAPTPNNPYNVIPGGYALIRNGMGDHLLLKRGDTFAESQTLVWNRSGFSSAYPAVLGTYGTGPRPVIDRGGFDGMAISPGTGPTVRYVAVTGIDFRASRRDWNSPNFFADDANHPGRPAIFVGAGPGAPTVLVEDVLMEDCKIEFHGGGVSLVGTVGYVDSIRNVRINRNVFADIYVPNGYTTAMYASNVTGLTVTENLIDGVQRTAQAAGVANVQDSAFSHGVYVQSDARDVVLEQNIFANAFDGGMMRPGGRYAGNLAIQTSIGTHQGYMFSNSAPIITDGVESTVIGNAFLGPWQYGIQIGNIREGFLGGNLLLSSGGPQYSVAFNLIGRTDLGQHGLRNLTIFNNFVHGTESLDAAGPEFENVTVSQNQFRSPLRIINHVDYQGGDFHYSNNGYHSASQQANQWFRVQATNYDLAGWTLFMEPSATGIAAIDPATLPSVATYNAFIGGASSETDFLAAARQQSRQSWDNRYMAPPVIIYLRMRLGLLP